VSLSAVAAEPLAAPPVAAPAGIAGLGTALPQKVVDTSTIADRLGVEPASEEKRHAQPEHEIAIIGAGISGLGIAAKLLEAGHDDLVIYERADDIGGTWRDNVYPGVGVDVPCYAYQFSFDLSPEWSRLFPLGEEVQAHVNRFADRHDLRQRVRFNSDVECREWNPRTGVWDLIVSGEPATARYVISAIGGYCEPKLPNLPGLSSFTGTILQSARWDRNHDVTGERVAVIGTGSTAAQIIPEIAPITQHLDVYQRTPVWVLPKPDPATSKYTRWLLRRSPGLQRRLHQLFNDVMEKFSFGALLNYHRPRVRRSFKVITWLLREVFYRRQVPDSALRRRLTPEYALGCKRPIFSKTYLKTYTRPEVELITDPIAEILPGGIRTQSGQVREVDTIILATGFHLSHDPETYAARPVRGHDGFDLESFYRDSHVSSYHGTGMPGLPNHFIIFGPYAASSGVWHGLVESTAVHIIRVLNEAKRRGATIVEPRPEPTAAWSNKMAHGLDRSPLKQGGCLNSHTIFINRHGDIPFIRATSVRQAFEDQATFPLDDYTYA
jgi:cation diffusion facilitator CzcD-associated flavoprotein CzcO